jgi:hypothetical protein
MALICFYGCNIELQILLDSVNCQLVNSLPRYILPIIAFPESGLFALLDTH